tara:strand:- start:491 stop:1267 length:777 start_codon:yes stop_codon:yes gene_type:complete
VAGDWIKIKHNTMDGIEVQTLAHTLGIKSAEALGYLCLFWRWFDVNTVDGRVDGDVDGHVVEGVLQMIDSQIAMRGFCDAMQKMRWLAIDELGISIPNFLINNGHSAKERSQKTARQAKYRAKVDAAVDGHVDAAVDGVATTSASTREEKRRIKDKPPYPLRIASMLAPDLTSQTFASFWDAYPKRKDRKNAEKAWARLAPDATLQAKILAAVQHEAQTDDWQKQNHKYVPLAATWLNARRWEDETSPATADIFSRAI